MLVLSVIEELFFLGRGRRLDIEVVFASIPEVSENARFRGILGETSYEVV
jgi:hypothetical protein